VLALAAAAAVLLLPRSDHAASPQPPIVTPSPSPSPEPTPAPHRGETFDHFGERPRDVVVAGQRVWVISHGRQKVLTKDLVQTDRDSYFIGYGASDIAADANDDVWITREIGRQLLRLDGRTGRRELTVPTPGRPRLLVAGRSRVWVAMQEDRESPAELVPYDPATGTWGTALPFQDGIAALTYGAGSVWVTTNKPGELVRITPDGDPKHVTWFGDEGSDLAYGAGQVWASVPARDAVVHGLERGSYRSENVDGQPAGIAVWHGVIFVARESVDRVDGYRLRGRWKRVYKIPVADTPHALAVGGGHLWVACIGEGALERIDW
jgi:streptogramin lyase